jgi:hypothetical protein
MEQVPMMDNLENTITTFFYNIEKRLTTFSKQCKIVVVCFGLYMKLDGVLVLRIFLSGVGIIISKH